MKITSRIFTFLLLALAFAGCYTEDPGPHQREQKLYTITDFDRIEAGDGLKLTVQQGEFYEVRAEGDRRNVNDLIVENRGTTLVVYYSNQQHRQYDTYLTIRMPSLKGANFSGASDARVTGFNEQIADLSISGASLCQLSMNVVSLNVNVSGASQLNVTGNGEAMNAIVSGASLLRSTSFKTKDLTILASGASNCQVLATDQLNATAAGASTIIYRGNPSVVKHVEGSSVISQE